MFSRKFQDDRSFTAEDVRALAFAHTAAASGAAPVPATFSFEGLGGTFGTVTGLGGYDWTNFGYIKDSEADAEIGPSGFSRGVAAGHFVAYNNDGETGSTISSDYGNFNVNSVWLTAGVRDGMSVSIDAYDDGVLKYHTSVTIGDDAATKFTLGFRDVDTVTFTPTGGTSDVATVDAPYLVFDNVVLAARTGAITGTVFNDKDRDGIQEAGESGLSGRTVFVDANHNGVLDTGETQTVTGTGGVYTFNDLAFGRYDVVEVPLSGQAVTPTKFIDDYTFAATAFRFVDIAQPGNAMVFADKDDGFAFFEPSSPVKFYGQSYGGFYISTNGFIQLGPDDGVTKYYDNVPIGSTNPPNGIIAPLWDDYNLTNAGAVYAVDDSAHKRFIVEWKDVPIYNDTTGRTSTFEAIIGYNGSIQFQYLRVNQAPTVTATVGVENQDGSLGTGISFGAAPDNRSGYLLTPDRYQQINGHASVDVFTGETTTVNFGNRPLPPSSVPAGAFASDTVMVDHAAFHAASAHGVLAGLEPFHLV